MLSEALVSSVGIYESLRYRPESSQRSPAVERAPPVRTKGAQLVGNLSTRSLAWIFHTGLVSS